MDPRKIDQRGREYVAHALMILRSMRDDYGVAAVAGEVTIEQATLLSDILRTAASIAGRR